MVKIERGKEWDGTDIEIYETYKEGYGTAMWIDGTHVKIWNIHGRYGKDMERY